MSVLVEPISIIVRRRALDHHWPGGADAYLAAAISAEPPASVACADDDLTSVSFLATDDCRRWLERLEQHDITDAVALDPFNPLGSCDWIEWRQHPDGFVYAWLAGTDPGSVVAPTILRPSESRRKAAGDGDHMLRLANEDGVEYWLDLETGQQITSLAQPEDSAATPLPPDRSPLMPVVRGVIDRLEWTPDTQDDVFARIRMSGKLFLYSLLIVVDDRARTIVCYGTLPVRADHARRAAVAEAVVRINQSLRIGSFDLDFDDGEIRYRTGCDVEGGTLTEHMVMTMVGNVCGSIERFAHALMQVLFGQTSAEEAVHQVFDAGNSEEA
jgi:hypothetical protein